MISTAVSLLDILLHGYEAIVARIHMCSALLCTAQWVRAVMTLVLAIGGVNIATLYVGCAISF